MCGILGVVGPDYVERFGTRELELALDEMRERGPDGRGTLATDGGWFGHRRLAIIDLGGGAQPMTSADEDVVLTYNGEIFNYQDVARRLRDPSVLRTRSDTEVVLHAVRERGPEALRDFRGMFAFGWYDRTRRALLLARDPLGIKPLYYARVGRSLVFASELEPLRKLLGTPRLRASAYVDYLRYAYVPEPDTVFEGIHALLPGHFLRFSDGEIAIREYWRPSLGSRDDSTDVDHIESVVREATSLATVSDVPIAALLSGGIDSAVIAANLGQRAAYFNLLFDGAYDESDRARYTQSRLGLEVEFERRSMEADPETTAALLRKVGQPFGDTSLFAGDAVFSRVVRRHKVCLSGDGADEVFAGYSMRRLIAIDETVGRGLGFLGAVGRPAAAQVVHRILRTYLDRTRLPLEQYVDPAILRAHDRSYERLVESDVRWALERTDDLVNVVSYVFVRRNLPNDMLVKVDRSSMYRSLEVRVPFLDHVVVEEGLRLPGRAKQDLQTAKSPLRQILRRRGFSEDFLRARKTGFGPPAESWAMKLPPARRGSFLEDLLTPIGRDVIGQSVFGRLAALWESVALHGAR